MSLKSKLIFITFPLFYYGLLFAQKQKIVVNVTKQLGEDYRTTASFKQETGIDFIAGIPSDLDTMAFFSLDFCSNQTYYLKYINGEISKEDFEKSSLNPEEFVNHNVKSKVYALSGLKNQKKIIIADANNNYDLSDDLIFEYDTNLTIDEMLELSSSPQIFYYEYVQQGKTYKGNAFAKISPFIIIYDRKTQSEKVHGLSIGHNMIEYYYGSFQLDSTQYNIKLKGFHGQGFRSSFIEFFKHGQRNSLGNINYSFHNTLFIGNNKIRIDSFDVVNDRVFLNFLEKVKDHELIGGGVDLLAPQIFDKDIYTGDFVNLKNILEQNKYVLIDFWGTWCSPCKAQFPDVIELSKKYQSKGLEVLGVAADRTIETTKTYLEENKLPWQNVFMSYQQVWDQESISGQYWVRAFPSYFLVDPNGIIIAREKNIEPIKEKITSIFEEDE